MLGPATYVGETAQAAEGNAWDKAGCTRFLRFGAPIPGDMDRLPEGSLHFGAAATDRHDREEFRALYESVIPEWARGDGERLWMYRHLPVTPETCRILPADDDRTAADPASAARGSAGHQIRLSGFRCGTEGHLLVANQTLTTSAARVWRA